MTVSLSKRLAVSLLLAVFACSLAGCWNPFAPAKGDPDDIEPAEFRERTSPRNVLHNIETAYEQKNVSKYMDCLSDDFIFYTSEEDQTGGDPLDPQWYRIDEEEMHEGLFGTSQIDYISLTLTVSDTTHFPGDPQDPDDDEYVFIENVDLRVYEVGGYLRKATTPQEYHFRIDDQVGPNGETLWEIYRWWDLGRGRGDVETENPHMETMSLARLKSHYAN